MSITRITTTFAIQRWLLTIMVLMLLLALPVAAWDMSHFWNTHGRMARNLWHLFEYWGCWALWPTCVYLFIGCVHNWQAGQLWRTLWHTMLLAVSLCFIWGRFVEPNQIAVHQTTLPSGCQTRVALIADIHAGLFDRDAQLRRLVTKLNALEVDSVLIAGDWTYEASPDLDRTLSPFGALKHPAYTVLGNHDKGLPGPPVDRQLKQSIGKLGIHVIEGKTVTLGHCLLVGLGDNWAKEDRRDWALVNAALTSSSKPVVVLTHNPDTAQTIPGKVSKLVMAGHTHGGQVRLPWLTKRVLRTATTGQFDHGLYHLPNTSVFVTAGTGRIGMPFRFANPPVIDVLNL